MLAARFSLLLVATALFAGCSQNVAETDSVSETQASSVSRGSKKTGSPKQDEAPAAAGSQREVLEEAVLVLFQDDGGEPYFCTGSLVAKDRVVTAGHCLERGRFHGYEIVAPLAPGKPRVTASNPTPMSDEFADVAQPDFGFLTLDEPIELDQYAVLTDVSARVEGGETLKASVVVRTEEEPEAPVHVVNGLELRSTTSSGYDHGFGVRLFSHGGDSGAGFFLAENGRTSHKLVGVVREPDPDSDTDHVTRIDADVLAWYRAHAE